MHTLLTEQILIIYQPLRCLQLKLVNGVEHDVAVEGFGATELAGAGTYVAAFGCLLAEQVNGF